MMKAGAELGTLDEEVQVDAATTVQSDVTEGYFQAGNTEGDDTGLTLDSIQMDVTVRRSAAVSVSYTHLTLPTIYAV